MTDQNLPNTQPAALTAQLHLRPDQVTAVALRPAGTSVALRFGDDNAQVSILGSLAEVEAIVQAAVEALDVIAVVAGLDGGPA